MATVNDKKRDQATEEKFKVLREKAARHFRIASSGIKIVGALTLMGINPAYTATALGAFVGGSETIDLLRAIQNQPFQHKNPSTKTKLLKALFNSATLAAGVALLVTPATVGVPLTTAGLCGSWMSLTGGINTFTAVRSLFTKSYDPAPAPKNEP